ncbi:MAG TPA: zinc ribbon domain-containing protein [Thermoanaerobaculia bacterium]|nr:zinc ribbon domain-containing protein [Thermoanaerobaculia bacterium]
MPLYEFECRECGATFELMRSVSSRPPRKCPECGAAGTVSKRVSAPAFQFKGSGWYVTDYAARGKGDKAKESGGEDKPAAKGDGAAEPAKETKPAKEPKAGAKAKD